jgi:hypothetical protein
VLLTSTLLVKPGFTTTLQDNTESEWEPEYVGAGLGLKQEDPMNWQYSLRHSNHPLAPFPGEALKWSSYVYDDGTT